jgi:hypothetical protein
MDKEFDYDRFEDAIKYSALEDDIKMLLHGLNT